MRFLTADYLFPLHQDPIEKGVLEIFGNGEVKDIHKSRKNIPIEKLEVYQGVLCPGFINAHCHLELSYFHNKIKKDIGLVNFIDHIKENKNFSTETIYSAIELAEEEMIKNGIVGVGDISNTNHTIYQKKKNKLKYYNFLEIFQTKKNDIEQTFNSALKLQDEFKKAKLHTTIVPHAAYSVLPDLMCKILHQEGNKDELLCIHNFETNSERELFSDKKGELYKWLKNINTDESMWNNKISSLDMFRNFTKRKLMFVHNTFTVKEEVTNQIYCTCPKANLYIEGVLPDYSIFNLNKLCVGTDSLASNDKLSILDELFIIQTHTNFSLNTLLKLACLNGAKALGFTSLGSFKKGNNPGVNLITQLKDLKITEQSNVSPLL